MNLWAYKFVMFFICLLTPNLVFSRKIHQRQMRSVISLPSDSSLSVTTDLIVPVLPLLNTTNTYLWFNFPVTFDVPTAEDLSKLYASFGTASAKDEDKRGDDSELDHNMIEEKRAHHDRRQVYKYLEGFLRNFGLDGPACLQRAICELADAPLGSQGLLGRAFDILFSPYYSEEHSSSKNSLKLDIPEDLQFLHNTFKDDYSQAYQTGKQGSGCEEYSRFCLFSFFKILNL